MAIGIACRFGRRRTPRRRSTARSSRSSTSTCSSSTSAMRNGRAIMRSTSSKRCRFRWSCSTRSCACCQPTARSTKRFRRRRTSTEAHELFDLDGGQWDIPELRAPLEQMLIDRGAGFRTSKSSTIFRGSEDESSAFRRAPFVRAPTCRSSCSRSTTSPGASGPRTSARSCSLARRRPSKRRSSQRGQGRVPRPTVPRAAHAAGDAVHAVADVATRRHRHHQGRIASAR